MNMRELLERKGCVIRGRRADCTNCIGGSRGTVSFTDEVGYCHRCAWRANVRTLSRELGLLTEDPEARRRFAAEQRERERKQRVIDSFEQWQNSELRKSSDRYREFARKAEIAKLALRYFPGWEQAWEVLAAFYHAEAALSRRMDFLICAKASPWLSSDAAVMDVFETWQKKAA